MEGFLQDEIETRRLGMWLAGHLAAGDVLLLSGELGAGKTTLVRGFLAAKGQADPVRSPTFNLLSEYLLEPPVLHADLYRLKSHQGLGLEEYLDQWIVIIEWPDRAEGLLPIEECYRLELQIEPGGRKFHLQFPQGVPEVAYP